jgi:hypothetical protein
MGRPMSIGLDEIDEGARKEYMIVVEKSFR